ncbi:hypothetical protein BCR42DRAFT_399024 [Absidia repens]|uniref:Uncharacterized protein n=1 Tax=Absidia repens TaxID=90262 RepID=A0A1X2HKK3_9FUNG|nr:hypothetical protein BCR42DRAFT_399024 [Absidia repens]
MDFFVSRDVVQVFHLDGDVHLILKEKVVKMMAKTVLSINAIFPPKLKFSYVYFVNFVANLHDRVKMCTGSFRNHDPAANHAAFVYETGLAFNLKRITVLIIVVVTVDIIDTARRSVSLNIVGVSDSVNKPLRKGSMFYTVDHTLSIKIGSR